MTSVSQSACTVPLQASFNRAIAQHPTLSRDVLHWPLSAILSTYLDTTLFLCVYEHKDFATSVGKYLRCGHLDSKAIHRCMAYKQRLALYSGCALHTRRYCISFRDIIALRHEKLRRALCGSRLLTVPTPCIPRHSVAANQSQLSQHHISAESSEYLCGALTLSDIAELY